MRSEVLGPRTWLLLAVAGWTVLAWLLALAGMGSRIVPLPDNPALVQALPAVPPLAAERLGPLQQYSEITRRPVFASDRQPHDFFLEGQGGEQTSNKGFDYVLTSVLITPRVRLAILQSPGEGGPASAVRVKVGDAPPATPAWHLTELEPRQAVFEGPEGRRTLALRVFDGQGGEPPTQLAGAQRPGQPPPPPRSAPLPPRPAAPQPASERPSPSDTQVRGASPAANADAADPAPPQTTEQQMQAIRERIEARRRQMREQQNSGTPGTTK